ncbi:MAG: hypothetical protein CEE40_04325 [Chloroflexi bacterium B3_Chlor]|nr:MAG: hypothetical protein CEE40_04325 [Chloroflexi bacterium B3_Chlor]
MSRVPSIGEEGQSQEGVVVEHGNDRVQCPLPPKEEHQERYAHQQLRNPEGKVKRADDGDTLDQFHPTAGHQAIREGVAPHPGDDQDGEQ